MANQSDKQPDPELIAKAEQLKASPLFINPSEDAELLEKQAIFLVLAGVKPVAEVQSGHWEETPNGRHTVHDDEREVARLLESLGLQYSLSNDGYAITAIVSLQSELLEQMKQAADPEAIGLLFGYPATASHAYMLGNEALLSLDEQHQLEQANNIPLPGSTFRFSKEHSQEELATVAQWYDLLRAYGLSAH